MEDSTVGRTQSKIYNNGKYGPVLRFWSIDNGLVDKDKKKPYWRFYIWQWGWWIYSRF